MYIYMKCGQGSIEGLPGAYVDDCLLAGDEGFQTRTEKILLKFDTRPREWDIATFLGVPIRTIQNSQYRWFEMQQQEYIANLKIIPQDTKFSVPPDQSYLCLVVKQSARYLLRNKPWSSGNSRKLSL